MIYIFETELNENNLIFYELTKIYGIGKSKSYDFCKKLGFSSNLKIKDLTKDDVKNLIRLIERSNIIINNDLKRLKSLRIKNLINLKLNRGIRISLGLPNRGQRTHTNGKSAKNNKILYK